MDTLDLIKMLLRFSVDGVGFSGDLKQFYPSIALDKSQWNLQRVLWKENMSPDAPVEEWLIISLIFGVRVVSALTEKSMDIVGEDVAEEKPREAEVLADSRFVDDIGDSDKDKDTVKGLTTSLDKIFSSVGLSVKGWCMSGEDPHPDVTVDGMTVDVGGMSWIMKLDLISIKIPPLHFGKKSRGKLVAGTEVFDGSFSDLQKFLKRPITRRHVVGKVSAIFDPYGKLTPITAMLKSDARVVMKETID